MQRKTIWPDGMQEFMAEHVEGRSGAELTDLVNNHFQTTFTVTQIRAYRGNHHLRSGLPAGVPAGIPRPSKVFPPDVRDFIVEHYKGCGPTEMSKTLNARFNAGYTAPQIKAFYANHHLHSGVSGRFQKGKPNPHKGCHVHHAGCEKTYFQPGNLPATTKPLGYERVTVDGYTEVKVRMRPRERHNDNFISKQRYIWEQLHGPLPEGSVVIFLDGDRTNFSPDNLACVTQAEKMELARRKLYSSNPELTQTGIAIARLNTALHTHVNQLKEDK